MGGVPGARLARGGRVLACDLEAERRDAAS
jgi:hypothetical protein